MGLLKCTKCNEEAHSYKELVDGKCRFCNGELEEEEFSDTERDMGYYHNDF